MTYRLEAFNFVFATQPFWDAAPSYAPICYFHTGYQRRVFPMADINPEQVAAEMVQWSAAWNWTAMKFSMLTIIFAVVVVVMFQMGNLKEVTKNFAKYRCNPMIMPFAANFGYDAKDNFNFCLSSVFNVKAAEVFAPIYKLLSQFTAVITQIVNATLGIRKLFSNFFLSVNGFIANVRNRIQELLFRIRMSFLKMTNLMGKVYGTMYSVIWMGTSALTAGNNLADNGLVRFLFSFCFDPETPVRMEKGTVKPIREVMIGDRLAPVHGKVPVVSSVFRFNGQRTPMVRIADVSVSSQHYVQHMGKWIEAADHPSAFPTDSLDEIVCLNVTDNAFIVGNGLYDLIVSDYDEHVSPGIIQEAQETAMAALNGKERRSSSIDDYGLGVDARMEVQLADGSWKPMGCVKLADVLKNSGEVLGVVVEKCDATAKLPTGCKVSAAQLMFDARTGRWARAGSLFAANLSCESSLLVQLITENCGTIAVRDAGHTYYIRDYREVGSEDMEAPYAAEFARV